MINKILQAMDFIFETQMLKPAEVLFSSMTENKDKNAKVLHVKHYYHCYFEAHFKHKDDQFY